jgi:predicted RNA-binding protein with PIN domain
MSGDPGATRLPLALLPDALLGPIVDAALERLRDLPAADVPIALRPVLGFDRRARQASALRRQVARALDADAALADETARFLAGRGPIAAAARTHRPDAPLTAVLDAAARGDLEQLVAGLWAVEPDGAPIALGAAIALEQFGRTIAELDRDRNDWEQRARASEEAARRAEASLAAKQEALDGAQQELRSERAARREREARADARAVAARDEVAAADARVSDANARADAADGRARADAARSRKLVDELREVRARLKELEARDGVLITPGELHDASRRATDLARELERLAARAPSASPSSAPPAKRARRPHAAVPPGLLAESPEGLAGMLAARDVVLLVDGYNVAFVAWPDASAADKREHVVRGLVDLEHRYGCEIVCVFDGDGTERAPLRRTGVRVVFSAAGEDADHVIVRTATEMPAHRPVVVASSDGSVRAGCEAAGATVVPSAVLVSLARSRPGP